MSKATSAVHNPECPVSTDRPVYFWENGEKYYFDHLGYRNPLKGEFFLHGKPIAAHIASKDLSDPRHVVTPTVQAKTTSDGYYYPGWKVAVDDQSRIYTKPMSQQ